MQENSQMNKPKQNKQYIFFYKQELIVTEFGITKLDYMLVNYN